MQLLNNLLVKKYYFYPNQEDFLKENNKSLFNNLKNFMNFFRRNKKKIEIKDSVNVNKIISS